MALSRKNQKKKILVTGASGMLGSTLYKVFTEGDYQVISTDLAPLDSWTIKLDVRDKKRVRSLVKEALPDFVFHLAALTDLEYCELHPQETFDTNALGTENMARVCQEFNLPLVYISTAGVFDGTKGSPYTEDDFPNPVMVYGQAKYEGEKAVSKILDKYFIFRAGWMMGGGERDKKFVKKILNLIDQGHKIIYALTDMYGSPTYTLDFSRGILKMIATFQDYGLYHMSGEGHCSRYDVAKKIVAVLNLGEVKVKPVDGNFFKQEFFAPRPPFEVLENKKLKDKNLKLMRQWDEALTDYLYANFGEKYEKKKR